MVSGTREESDAADRAAPHGGRDRHAALVDRRRAPWAAGGAQPAVHWSFRKIQRPEPPAVRDRAWVRNPIDQFRPGASSMPRASRPRRRLAKLTLHPAREPGPHRAARRPRRRSTRSCTTTAPTPTTAWWTGCSHSPHYGEKWARYWLDLARYADSDGYEKDRARPWAWRYRQWVIDALNRDMPYDEFTIEQLAGDLLPNRNHRHAGGHRIQPQHAHQSRGRHRSRAVPRRAGARSRGHARAPSGWG